MIAPAPRRAAPQLSVLHGCAALFALLATRRAALQAARLAWFALAIALTAACNDPTSAHGERIGQVQSADTGSALTPIKDTDVQSPSPTTNFGTNALMQIKSGGVNRVGIVSFNTAGLGNVTSAKLVLFVASADTIVTPVVTDVYYAPTATDSWSETGVTWNTTPSPGNSPSSGKIATLTISSNVVGTWLSWDVTSSVVADSDGIATFFITCNSTASGESVRFSTRETTNPPQLQVTTAPALGPTKDTGVESLNPTTNFGTNAVMQIKSSAPISRDALLSFDTSALTGVTSATLRLYVAAMDVTANTIAADVYYAPTASDSWSETGVTWNTTPAPGNTPSSGQIATQNITNAQTGSWISWDVTSSVLADSDGTATFLVTANAATPSAANVGFSTREGAHAPKLVIGSATTLALSSQTTYALASAAIPGGTDVFGGTAPHTCAVTSNTSGGSTCSVSNGVVRYTAGATAGYNIKAQRTNDYLRLVTASGGPYVETGGALGSAELWIMAVSGTGYTLKAKSTSKYMRNAGTLSTGNDLVADVAVGSAGVFAQQNCNGTGDPGQYNRFGFSSTTGSNPYWQAQASATVEAVNAGSGSACSPTTASPPEAFYLEPGTDTLTITDSASHTTTLTVSVENPIAFLPSSTSANQSTAITAVQAWGGSGVFTGGSAGCAVQTNNSGGGACSVTGYGSVTYTSGASAGVDTLLVTDSQGHSGTFSVTVTAPLAVSSTTSYALTSSALGSTVSVSGGLTPYSCSVTSSSSGGATCTVSSGVVTYSAGSAAGFNIRTQRSGDYLRLTAASGGPYAGPGGAVGSSAELWKMTNSGSGYLFQANSSTLYLRNGGTVSVGNDLIADAAIGSAAVFTMQNCNGTGNPAASNRFGFKSATGSSPYWQTQATSPTPTVDAVNGGSSAACDPNDAAALGAFYLVPGQDVLTISDSASHSAQVTVSVEAPISFSTSAYSVAGSTVISNQAIGGSGVFTGGSSGCSVSPNNTGGGACSTTSYGLVSYTVGTAAGTDTVTLTDSQGHTGSFTVTINGLTLSQIGASSNYFACARLSDGTARCWGYNPDGELGNGTTSPYGATPVAVSGINTVSAVTTGELHACALLADQSVRCWGDNTYGQLGNGTLTSSASPVTVSGLNDAMAVSAGMLHTCALRSDGTVVCWGYNANGQVGNSGSSYWPKATTPAAVTGLTNISALSSGGFHSCALSSGGAVKCWGDNSSYQLGNGAGGPSVWTFSPVVVSGLSSGVSSIGSGELHSCAVVSGAVQCWGDNTYGQLGTGDKISASTPVGVTGLSSVAQVAPGFSFTCARITDQTVKCWGRNADGEIGDTTSSERLSPTTVTGITTATSIGAGGLNACVTLSNGLANCWGDNTYGQIGNGTTTDAHTATAISFP